LNFHNVDKFNIDKMDTQTEFLLESLAHCADYYVELREPGVVSRILREIAAFAEATLMTQICTTKTQRWKYHDRMCHHWRSTFLMVRHSRLHSDEINDALNMMRDARDRIPF
jgi:hypothetical protein